MKANRLKTIQKNAKIKYKDKTSSCHDSDENQTTN